VMKVVKMAVMKALMMVGWKVLRSVVLVVDMMAATMVEVMVVMTVE